MIKRLTLNTLFAAVLLMAFSVSVRAQDLKVRSFAVAQGDLSASVNVRNDRNGVACGLVKVQLVGAGAKFEGNIIGDVSFQNNEYWVYMNQGAYLLNVTHPDFLPLDINLHDHGLKDGVQPKVTYKLVLTKPQGSASEGENDGNYVIMDVQPAGSVVVVDGTQRVMATDGTAKFYLLNGRHSYSVSATGYATKDGTLVMSGRRIDESVRLESEMASVRVTCATDGAQVYVNDQLKGTAPWDGQLAMGTYRIEARLSGYHSQGQTVQLSKREQRTLELPQLKAQVGHLNVDYSPTNVEVHIDGKYLGKSPDIFRNIIVGQHEVEIRKDGYVSKKEAVTIAEGQTASLSGTLTAAQSSSVNTATSDVSAAGSIETFTVNGVSFNMVRVEGGMFLMGSDDGDEMPVHQVTLNSYFIGETEVTQELWEAVMGKNPSHFKGSNLPVENVSWNDCQEFIKRLNSLTGCSFRLPTEAEWEFAARGGNRSKGYKYSGGNKTRDVAWYDVNSDSKTHPVKTKRANELGLYDMSGNVWEWCQDWYDSYSSASQTNPTGPSSGSNRVFRGGGWDNDARLCRSSYRFSSTPSRGNYYLGLRLAL